MRALELVERALERDPNYGSALAVAIGCQCNMAMEKAKRARKAETPKQPSLCLRLRAPYLYPDQPHLVPDRFGASRRFETKPSAPWRPQPVIWLHASLPSRPRPPCKTNACPL